MATGQGEYAGVETTPIGEVTITLKIGKRKQTVRGKLVGLSVTAGIDADEYRLMIGETDIAADALCNMLRDPTP